MLHWERVGCIGGVVGKSSWCMGYRTAVSARLSIWWWSTDGNFINGKPQNDEDSKSLVQWLVVQLCCWLEARVRCLYVSTSWRKSHYISSSGFSFPYPLSFCLHRSTILVPQWAELISVPDRLSSEPLLISDRNKICMPRTKWLLGKAGNIWQSALTI